MKEIGKNITDYRHVALNSEAINCIVLTLPWNKAHSLKLKYFLIQYMLSISLGPFLKVSSDKAKQCQVCRHNWKIQTCSQNLFIRSLEFTFIS